MPSPVTAHIASAMAIKFFRIDRLLYFEKPDVAATSRGASARRLVLNNPSAMSRRERDAPRWGTWRSAVGDGGGGGRRDLGAGATFPIPPRRPTVRALSATSRMRRFRTGRGKGDEHHDPREGLRHGPGRGRGRTEP